MPPTPLSATTIASTDTYAHRLTTNATTLLLLPPAQPQQSTIFHHSQQRTPRTSSQQPTALLPSATSLSLLHFCILHQTAAP